MLEAQYAPAAGKIGTTAIYKDSSAIVGWAKKCTIVRGPDDISSASPVYPTTGTEQSALGQADGLDVISLGDGGSATLEFESPILNGPGPDFAVFENSFSSDFLELAFVEVSSNGSDFVRFPAVSLTDTAVQVSSFGTLDATKIHNLAGKYAAKYGVPFDLEVLKDSLNIDLTSITHVRIVDVVGSVDPLHASYDSQGRPINDPWPTNFPSGGFDLDAVAVINSSGTFIAKSEERDFRIYPVPAQNYLAIETIEAGLEAWQVFDAQGQLVAAGGPTSKINCGHWKNGLYFLSLIINGELQREKFLVEH